MVGGQKLWGDRQKKKNDEVEGRKRVSDGVSGGKRE